VTAHQEEEDGKEDSEIRIFRKIVSRQHFYSRDGCQNEDVENGLLDESHIDSSGCIGRHREVSKAPLKSRGLF
jgi:hypothetical protein